MPVWLATTLTTDMAITEIPLKKGEVMPHVAVVTLRDYIVAAEPSLKEPIDHYIEQIKELSYHYLRAIESDLEDTCRDLDIQTGGIKPVTLSSLAKGVHDDRKAAEDRRFSSNQMIAGVVLSAFLAWLVTFLAVGEGS